jgi:RNA polymerase sigma factor (sigma-70 family)
VVSEPCSSESVAVASLAPLIRSVVASRVDDPHAVEDLVQETLVRVIAARTRLEDVALAPYAVVVARNLVTTTWAERERGRRYAHRVTDLPRNDRNPESQLIEHEEASALTVALARLNDRDRESLLAHEVDGRDTRSLAQERQTTPAAVATQLSRARARLRVEYLLQVERSQLPTPRCRPVLLAVSSGDRRRQADLDVGHHLLDCEVCSRLSRQLLDRRGRDDDADATIEISVDEDVVSARQKGRALALEIGFGPSESTVIATAISEIARNIVQFAKRGQIMLSAVEQDHRRGLTVVARDVGPGIADLALAQTDGFSSYGGMGLGLPGARRLMDEFDITSEPGKGTVVVMTKWRRA